MSSDKLTDEELQARLDDGEEIADVLAESLFGGRWFPPRGSDDD